MLTISFLSHNRLTKDDSPPGEEDELCRLALRYLVLNSPELVSVGRGVAHETTIHLYLGPLQGGGLGEPPDNPPFLWVFPVEVSVSGPDSGRLQVDSTLTPNLSAWSNTPPQRAEEVSAGLTQVLLPEIIKKVCNPVIEAVKAEKSERDSEIFAKIVPKPVGEGG
ncbi:hypothetical protein FQZ97_679230 [compost metagenome]